MGHHTFHVKSEGQIVFVDISRQVISSLKNDNVKDGVCVVFVPHTTAGVTINEAADPAVQYDILSELNKMVPHQDGYTHIEGNSAAHIKASLMGSSVSIPISDGKLSLGTWQGIFLCEFDGPRRRSVHCTFLSSR